MRIALFLLSLNVSMVLVSDVLMRFSTERVALSSAKKKVSRRVIKPVGLSVFTEEHIFIPMRDFDTLGPVDIWVRQAN